MQQLSFGFLEPVHDRPPNGATQRAPSPSAPLASRSLDEAYGRATALSKLLSERLGQRVRLFLTDNRSSMLSAREKNGRLEVRLHHMFLEADETVTQAIVRYLADGHKPSAKRIDRFVADNKPQVLASAQRRTTLRAKGKVYDLDTIAAALGEAYFSGPVSVNITWGKRSRPKPGQRSVQLGTYLPDEKLIRIHPVLDQPWVPRFFIDAVVYHELLHHDMPAVVQNGRSHYHTPAFRKREKRFAHHDAASRWEKENLWRLLRGV